MAFTALSFSSGELLTSSKMNLMMSNFKSLANQETTAPRITKIPRAWVNHDGAASMVGSQYNISSVADIGFGKYQTNFSVVFSGTYGATWGFLAGGGQGDNRMRNITLYTIASTFARYKGRNSTTQQSGDEEFPMSLVFWQV